MASFYLEPIATLHSPFKEKFGTPRQPGLAPAATGSIELCPHYSSMDSVRGLEQFSHIWLLFVFDRCLDTDWRPTVRPPRLGGNQRIGVFASRSNFRPNPIGQSVVQLDGIECTSSSVTLNISNFDLLDQTPILDIKPYITYSDSKPDARCGYASSPPERLREVCYSDTARTQLKQLALNEIPPPLLLIEQMLLADPRPAYQKSAPEKRHYGMEVDDFNISFHVEHDCVTIDSIETA